MVRSIDPRHETFRLIHWPLTVAAMFGTRVAETILASAQVRARQQAGHMDASDLIRVLQEHPCEEGAVHIWFHIAMRLQHTKLAAANLSTDDPDRVTVKAVIVAEVERLHWRI